MALAEMAHEQRMADLRMAIRYMEDARIRLALGKECDLALKLTTVIRETREAVERD